MTRETKIGLLVGLAFIIVIGILLSDHLTSATEPQQAALAQVAGNVRSGVTVPGANSQPPITTVTTPNQAATPQQTVLTKEELAPKAPPVEIVQIGGARPQAPQAITVKPGEQVAVAPQHQTSEPAVIQTPVEGAKPATPVNSSLAKVAESFGEQVVPTGAQPKNDASTTTVAAALPAGSKPYKAESGDSVSRLASRLMGGNTKANRDAIIAANPTLQQNGNVVILGRTYVIPAAAGTSAAAPAPAAPVTNESPVALAPPANEMAPTSTPQFFYTVKPGDSLTKIAVEQLGSAGGVPAIMDLNKDALKGRDIIRPNMKLRLPAKPLASAE
jgi:nucleoid-associated protein YgaU